MQSKTLRTIGATVVLAAVFVAAMFQMGSGETIAPDIAATDSTTTTRESTSPSSDPTTTLPEPFTYRVGLMSGISTDNFWAFYGAEPSVWNSYVLGPTKPALYTAAVSGGSLQPELAAGEVDPPEDSGGWHVMIDLNPELTWSDGTPVTAHDLVFTFDTVRALDLGGSWADSFPDVVESVVAEGDHQIRIGFTKRPQLSVWPHGVGLAPVMARHIWEDPVADLDSEALFDLSGGKDVGGGPLAIQSVSETVIASVANPGYPNGSVPDEVEYHVYANEEEAAEALMEGEIDAILNPRGLTAEQARTVDAGSSVDVVTSPGNAIRYLGFNLNRAPMADPAFRTALALLIDRDELANTIPGTGDAAWSLVPEANSRWFDDEAAEKIRSSYQGSLKDRLDNALKLLRAAGYDWEDAPTVEEGKVVAGTGLTIDGQTPQPLTILTPGDAYDPARPLYVEAIAATLSGLGFDARPVETDFDSVVDLVFTPNEEGEFAYDMYALGWTLGNPSLPSYYGALFASDGVQNNTGYASAEFDDALSRYEIAPTMKQAKQALWEMEAILAVDLPYLPLYNSAIAEAYRSDRVTFDSTGALGGIQGRLGGIGDVAPTE